MNPVYIHCHTSISKKNILGRGTYKIARSKRVLTPIHLAQKWLIIGIPREAEHMEHMEQNHYKTIQI